MATRTIPGPVIDEANVVLDNVLLFSMDARAISASAYHKVEVGLASGAYTTWIGTWNQSTQKIDAGESLRILDDDRIGMRLPQDKALVVRVTSSGSPATIETAKVDFVLSRVGGRAGARKPLLADVEAEIRSVTRQLASWTYPVYLRDPEDTTYHSPYVLDSNNETVTVVSTTSETTLYSVTVPAGLVSGERSLRCTVTGVYVNNDGAARNLTFTVKYDNTSMWGDLVSITNSASTYGWEIVFTLSPTNEATSAQHLSGYLGFFGPAGASVAGYGDLGTASVRGFGGDATEDASTALVLAVTLTHGTSSANITASKYHGKVEVL